MWPGELASANLPPVCLKTGQLAAGYHTVKLVPPDSWVLTLLLGPFFVPGVRVRIPLARRPLTLLSGLMLVRGLSGVLGPACLLAAFYVPGAPRTLLLIAGVLSASVAYSSYVVYFVQAHMGEVYRSPTGESWVRLRPVHPNFAAAVEAWRAAREAALREPAAYSADLRWHWNGEQWVSTLPAGMNVTNAGPPGRRIVWWQAAAGMLIGWALLGGIAWWRFHG
jgi:hypothetical protein